MMEPYAWAVEKCLRLDVCEIIVPGYAEVRGKEVWLYG